MNDFYCKVETEASEFDVEVDSMIRASLTEEAENNRANLELVQRLSDILDTEVAIIEGSKKRRKKLKIDISKDKMREKVEEWEKQR
jgi:uncharacterized protein YggU (UPF0235/DUF167 family)